MIERPRELHPRSAPERSRRRLRREWPVGIVLLGILGSLGWLALDHFRPGLMAFATSVAVAAVLRLFLPARHVGLLAVRGRALDVTTLLILAVGAMVLAVVVPSR